MSDIELLDQEVGTMECPECGNNAYHLKGIYVNEEYKYTSVLTVLNCEYCESPFGRLNSYGKGHDIVENVRVNRLTTDWKKVL